MKVFYLVMKQYALKPREKLSDKERDKEKNEKVKKNYEELITKIFKSSTNKDFVDKNKIKVPNTPTIIDPQISPNFNISKLKLHNLKNKIPNMNLHESMDKNINLIQLTSMNMANKEKDNNINFNYDKTQLELIKLNSKSNSINERKDEKNFTERKLGMNTSKFRDAEVIRQNLLMNIVEVQLNTGMEQSPVVKNTSPSSLARVNNPKTFLNTSVNHKDNKGSISKRKLADESTPKIKNNLKNEQHNKAFNGVNINDKLNSAKEAKFPKKIVSNRSKKMHLNSSDLKLNSNDIIKTKKESYSQSISSVNDFNFIQKEKSKEFIPLIKKEDNLAIITPKNITKFSKVVALDLHKCRSSDKFLLNSSKATSFVPTIQTNLYNEQLVNKNSTTNLNDQSVISSRSSNKSIISLSEARKIKNKDKMNNSFTNDSKSLSKEKFMKFVEQFKQDNLSYQSLILERETSHNVCKIDLNTNENTLNESAVHDNNLLLHDQYVSNPNKREDEIDNIRTKSSYYTQKASSNLIINKLSSTSCKLKELSGNSTVKSSDEYLNIKYESKLDVYRIKRRLTSEKYSQTKSDSNVN